MTLRALSKLILYLFNLVKWVVNKDKSVLVPTQKVTFLGATWLKDRVLRSTQATLECARIWAVISAKGFVLDGRPLEQVRGFLNYYFAFAGNFHSLINQILTHSNKIIFSKIFWYLINKNTIYFNFPRVTNDTIFVNFALDATEHQLAALEMSNTNYRLIIKSEANILVNGHTIFKFFFSFGNKPMGLFPSLYGNSH